MVDPQERSAMFDASGGGGEPPQKKSKRGLIIGIIGGVLALLVICVGGAIAGLAFLGSAVEERQSSIPELVSADTQIYSSITPALSDIPNIARIQNAYPELFVEDDPEAANELFEELDLDMTFEEDIQPWIGAEMSVAISGIEDFEALADVDDEEVFQYMDMAVIIASRDNDAAQEFVEKLRDQIEDTGSGVDTSTVNGVTVYEESDPPDERPAMAFGLVNSNFVFASNIAIIEQMAELEPEGGDTLASDAQFQGFRENQPENAIGYVYISGQFVNDLIDQGMDEAMSELDSQQEELLREQIATARALQSVGVSLSVESEGVAIDSHALVDLDQLNEEAMELVESTREPIDAGRLENISSDALALMTFVIPETFKDQFMTGFNAQPDAEESLAQMELMLGLNLEEDILDWMIGEWSIVVLPGESLGDVEFPMTGYIAITSEDQEAAEEGIAKISEVIELNLGVEFESEDFGNEEWQVLVEPASGQTVGGYSFIGDDLIIGFGNTAMDAASSGTEDPITENSTFDTVRSNLPEENSGVAYFKVDEIVSTLETLGMEPSTPEEEEFMQSIEPIEAIGLANEPGLNEEGVGHSRIFFYIEEE